MSLWHRATLNSIISRSPGRPTVEDSFKVPEDVSAHPTVTMMGCEGEALIELIVRQSAQLDSVILCRVPAGSHVLQTGPTLIVSSVVRMRVMVQTSRDSGLHHFGCHGPGRANHSH